VTSGAEERGLTFALLTDGVLLDGQLPGGAVVQILQSHHQLVHHVLPCRRRRSSRREEEETKTLPPKSVTLTIPYCHQDAGGYTLTVFSL